MLIYSHLNSVIWKICNTNRERERYREREDAFNVYFLLVLRTNIIDVQTYAIKLHTGESIDIATRR